MDFVIQTFHHQHSTEGFDRNRLNFSFKEVIAEIQILETSCFQCFEKLIRKSRLSLNFEPWI